MSRFKVVGLGIGPALQLNEADLEPLRALGCTVAYSASSDVAEAVAFAAGAHGIMLGDVLLSAGVLAQIPTLTVIGTLGVGFDNVDLAAATSMGVIVANTPVLELAEAVADHGMALLLALARHLPAKDRDVRAGGFDWTVGGIDVHLAGTTWGTLGFGRIGKQAAVRARAFGMRLIGFDPFVSPDVLRDAGIAPVTFPELLARSDALFVHCPLNAQTRHIIGAAELRAMKPSALLINCARGAIVEPVALRRALRERWIAGAGLDVYEPEPPPAGGELFALDNVILTPHSAGLTAVSVRAFCRQAAENVRMVLAGDGAPESTVNPEVLAKLGIRHVVDE